MLNIQRTIIILFAAVWVQSTTGEITKEEKQEIKYLEDSLIRARDENLIPKGRINHFKSWDSWNRICYTTKLSIASIYKEKLKDEKLKFDSGIDDVSKNKLAEFAYEALDEHINFVVRFFETAEHYKDDRNLISGMKHLANLGQFLKYYAFKGGPDAFLMQRRMSLLRDAFFRNFDDSLSKSYSFIENPTKHKK